MSAIVSCGIWDTANARLRDVYAIAWNAYTLAGHISGCTTGAPKGY